jgi:hypothetical protein
MKVILGFLILYLFLPYIGIFTFNQHEQNIFGTVSEYFKISYTIHLIIILLIITFFIYLSPINNQFNEDKNLSLKKINHIYNKSILFLLGGIFIQLFIFGGINILLGISGRGEFRTTLGFLGFFYNFLTMFLPAGIIVLTSIYYQLSPKKNKIVKKLYFIYFLGILIGVLTGFKYTSILIMSAGLVQMSSYIKYKYIILIGLLFASLTIFSAFYFMGFENGLDAWSYVMARATSVAAEGTVGVWNIFPDGGSDSWMALLYAFGNKIALLLTGYNVTDIEFLKINLTRLIGYLTYPKADEALSGAFNMTVTNFGEGVYYFGQYYYFIFSIITGILLGSFTRYVFITNKQPFIVKHTILVVYLMIVLFPWLMGGVIGNLFGIPTLVYLILLYIVLKLITSKIKYKDKI